MKYVKPTTEIIKLELEGAILNASDKYNAMGEGVQYSRRNDFDPESCEEGEYDED